MSYCSAYSVEMHSNYTDTCNVIINADFLYIGSNTFLNLCDSMEISNYIIHGILVYIFSNNEIPSDQSFSQSRFVYNL